MAQYTTDIQKLYVAYFGRPADFGGLNFYESLLEGNKTTLSAISASFAASNEYKAAYANMTPEQIINQVYLNLFGHSADLGGLQFWGPALRSGTITIDNAVTAIAAGAQGTDLTAFNDKVAAAAAFTAGLDTADKVIGYNGDAANAAAKAYIASVTDDASLATATAAAALAATITNVAALGNAVAGQTLTLTGGVDTVTGTAGNDTIVANYDVLNALDTLSALDTINGGAGVDTMNVTSTAAVSLPASATVSNVETVNITSAGTVQGDVSGWTGLTAVNVSEVGGSGGGALTAAATTNAKLTDSAAAASTISVQGGKDITVSALKVGLAGTINVGTTTAAKGNVVVTATESATQTTGTADAINVTGGSSVTVTANLTGALNNTITGGVVTVTGTADTKTVSVTQTKAATASATKAGVVDGAVAISDANAGSATKAATISTVSLNNYGNSTISSNALTNLTLAGKGGTLGVTSGLTTETVTKLNLSLVGATAGVLTDVSNHFTSIAVTTGTADSTLAGIADTAATSLTVAGTNALTLTSATGMTHLKTVTVSGAAGLTADVSAMGTVTDVNAAASSGTNAVTLLSTQTTYEGGSGNDTVTITAAPTKAISGGAGVDTLVINATAATFSNPSANTSITGFETLGLGAAANGTYDATGFLHLTQGAVAANVAYNNVAAGVDLTMTASPGHTTGYTLANATGTSDAIKVSLLGAGAIDGGTLTASGIEKVTLVATDTTSGVTDGATADALVLVDTAAKTISVTGNTTLTLTTTGNNAVTSLDASGMTGGIVASTNGVVNETLKGGASANILTAGAATTTTNDTLVGGAGSDTLKSNAGLDTLTGGAGADTFEIRHAGGNGNTYSTITDLTAGDDVIKFDMSAGGLTGGADVTSLLNSGTAVFQDYLNKAITAGAIDTIDWFTFGGNTYVVENVSGSATAFQNGTDVVVKLVGIVDLSNATFGGAASAGTITA